MNTPPLLCPWDAPTYLFFSENVPILVHYSHVVAIVAAFGMGLLILINNPRDIVARLLFAMTSLFTLWASLDVILWATNRPDIVMFSWTLQVLLEPLTYTVAFYAVYWFLCRKAPPFWVNLVVFVLLVPLAVLLPTTYDLQSLTLSTCEAVEGPLAKYYTYIIHGILTLGILFLSITRIPKLANRREKLISFWFIFGLVIFLLSFSSGNIISSFTDDWVISQYGLFGMPIFSALLAYSMVRFGAFNVKVIATQMLVTILAITVLSLTAIQYIATVRIIATLTFVLVCISGYMLVRSVKREVEQRQHIEKLAKELEDANEHQVNLIHFITHQIKGFVTKSRNIFSMALEGDFGEVNVQLKPMLQEGFDSDTKGAAMIAQILNAANIRLGKVEYRLAPLDERALIQDSFNLLKPAAEKKNIELALTLPDEPMTISGDKEQLGNVFRNLIDNSIKYTPSGNVSIALEKKSDKILFSVKDTGVGITPEDMKVMFTEGGHGKDSVKVNVESTGYGLYIVKQIVEGHRGRVWVESEGQGKGSKFYVELPAA